MELADDKVTFRMKKHYSSEESARQAVDKFLRSWELDYALRHDDNTRKIYFSFQHLKIIDRKPSATPTSGTKHELSAHSRDRPSATATGALTITENDYPQPPSDFIADSDVRIMWNLYEGYLDGRDRLMPMAYSCLSRLEFRASGRKRVETMYRVEDTVLRKLGHLTANVGDEVSARKLTSQSEHRSPTPAEVEWIKEVLKRLIRRAGEYAANPEKQWPQIKMSDLPSL